MNSPLISVLIPTYNVEPFVEEAIRSIMNQSYQNLEIIVVDDSSKDNTYAILQGLASEDSRIRLFRNEINQRIVKTLNFAITKARGEYYARMDGDDVSLPNKIQRQFEFLSQHPDVALVGTNALVIDEKGHKLHEEKFLRSHEEIKRASTYVSPVLHIWLAKSSLYKALGNYRIPSAEDLDFLLRAIDAGYKLANLPEPLYLLRQRQGNTATSLGLTQIKSIAYVRKLHKERVTNGSMKDSYSDENLQNALQVGALEKKRYEFSSRSHFLYVQNKKKNFPKALFYRLSAILASPLHQLRPIINRYKYKKLAENK